MQHHQLLRQHPFSLYDFLGYLIPSTMFFASIIFIDLYLFENCCGISGFLKDASKIDSRVNNFKLNLPPYFYEIFSSLFLIFLLYVAGQMLGVLSSYIIEKGYYVKRYGYPGECLLSSTFQENRNSKCSLLYVLSEFLMAPMSIIFNILKLFCIKFTHEHMFNKLENKILTASLKNRMQKIIKEGIEKDILQEEIKEGYYSFKIIYHNVIEVECPHLIKIYDCMCLYGFFRNLTLSFLLIFWVSLLYCIFHLTDLISYPSGLFCLVFFPVLALISFLGFHKFYTRYAKEVLYASLVNKPDNSDSISCSKKRQS